ncbi:MAG: helix-turn-helix domain-containing protein [Alphaproteobacteria bacterium]|nr:helix-turn-helix domain-containing protein [Alphaproteobacteria bacterium]
MTKKRFAPTSIDEHIGQRMQLRRSMMGLSQKDLAKLCGVTFQQIQKYETAGNRIAASRLFELSVALQTPVSFFFAGLPGHMEREPRNGHWPKVHVGDQTPFDPLAKNESLRLLMAYWKLPADNQRDLIMKMVNALNKQNKE